MRSNGPRGRPTPPHARRWAEAVAIRPVVPRLTPVIPLNDDEPDPHAITQAAGILRRGGLVAFATETVYGLGADATCPEAVARIFQAKGRPSFNPLIVHADDIEMARSCVLEWSESANVLARCFWPGPLTLVLPRAAHIPDVVTAGRDTVGVRIPDHESLVPSSRQSAGPSLPSARKPIDRHLADRGLARLERSRRQDRPDSRQRQDGGWD